MASIETEYDKTLNMEPCTDSKNVLFQTMIS
jgi:hypothetical protein